MTKGRGGKLVGLIWVLSALAAGCGGPLIDRADIEAAADAYGDWGWDRGAGCRDLNDVVRVGEGTITYIKDGVPIFEGRLHSREFQYQEDVGGAGNSRLIASGWLYSFQDPQTGERTVRQDRMHFRYKSVAFRGLQLAYRMERRGDGDWARVRPDDAERWYWLVHCEAGQA